MTTADALHRGRQSFERHAWTDAYMQLSAADQQSPLGAEDLERLAMSAYLIGQDGDSADLWTRPHHEAQRGGQAARAARCAFWLGLGLILPGEYAPGGGWLARAARLLEDGQLDCVEQGFLLVPAALQQLEESDAASAYATFSQAGKIANRFGDADLATLARLGRGQALIDVSNILTKLGLASRSAATAYAYQQDLA